jgi:hypothetical protein
MLNQLGAMAGWDAGGSRLHDVCASGEIRIVLAQCQRWYANKHNSRDCPAHDSPCSDCSSIDEYNRAGFTPFMLAARTGRVPVMEILIQHGADINAIYHTNQQTSFHHAVETANHRAVAALLHLRVNTDTQDINGRTPLMHCILRCMQITFNAVLSETTDVDTRDNQGNTALHIAATHGQIEMLQSLLDTGADVDATDYLGRTPLMKSAMYNQCFATEVLINAGADLEFIAVRPIVPLYGDDAVGGFEGRTALHFASQRGHFAVIQTLLEHGALEWKGTLCGATPLDLCQAEQLQLVEGGPHFGPSVITPLQPDGWWGLLKSLPQHRPCYTRSLLLLQQAEMARRRKLAVCMAMHERLGNNSYIGRLYPEVMRIVLEE